MKVVVAVKQVPDTSAEKTLDATSKRLNRGAIESVLNPFDEYAIEEALRLKDSLADGTTVTILTMAPQSGMDIVRKALGMGADNAAMLSDDRIGGSDAMATAYLLAQALKHIGFDLVLTGTQSTDAINSIVPAAIAEHLSIPALTYAKKLTITNSTVEIQRETENGYWRVVSHLPALVSVTKGINEPRYPTLKGIMGAKKKEITGLTLDGIGADIARIGGAGAKTQVISFTAVGTRARGEVFQASDSKAGAQKIMDFLIAKKVV